MQVPRLSPFSLQAIIPHIPAINIEGPTKADFTQALKLFKESDYRNALPLFESSAARNIANAWYYLGLIYENGLGVEPNATKAREDYIQAMKLNGEAITSQQRASPKYLDKYFMGRLLEAGYSSELPGEPHPDSIFHCYVMASNAGNPEASRAIASLMERDAIRTANSTFAAQRYRELADEQESRLNEQAIAR